MKLLTDQEKLVALYDDKTKAKAKLAELYKKLEEYEAKVAFRLAHFRGVAHESASGELASSELKVLQDHVASLKAEIKILESKMSGPKVLDRRSPA
jgi:hypothetical protein